MSRKRRVMVCVTQQKSCERLMSKGVTHRRNAEDDLYMVHVVKENWKYFSQLQESDAMEYLYDIAKDNDASINVMKATDIEETLAQFVRKYHIDVIVMGASREGDMQQNMIYRLKEKIPQKIEIDIVPLEGEIESDSDSDLEGVYSTELKSASLFGDKNLNKFSTLHV